MDLRSLASLSLLLIWPSFAFAGSTNHGGDGIGITYARARDLAYEMIKSYENNFRTDGMANAELKTWFEGNASLLAEDVLESPHRLVDDARPHNASTHLTPKAEVEISRAGGSQAFRPTREDAAMLLIHESAHHLGIADEPFAYLVAARIGANWDKLYGPASRKLRISKFSATPPEHDEFVKAVMMDKEIFYWGGSLAQGLIFDTVTGKSRKISSVGQPAQRKDHSLTWTGTHVIVWGGQKIDGHLGPGDLYSPDRDEFVADGSIYSVEEDTWTSIPIPVNSGEMTEEFLRMGHSALWTGNEVIIWSGHRPSAPYQSERFQKDGQDHYKERGLRFNPVTKQWKIFSLLYPVSEYIGSAAYLTGDTGNASTKNKMLVMGSVKRLFDLGTETWTKMSSAPSGTAVVVGQKMVFGDATHAITAVSDLQTLDTYAVRPSIHAPIYQDGYNLRPVAGSDTDLIFFGIRSASLSSIHVFDAVQEVWRAYDNDELLDLRKERLVWTGESFIGGLGEFRLDLPR